MYLIIKLILTLIFLAYIPSLYSLYRNYQTAKKVGLPIFLTPIDKFKPFWAIFGPGFIFPILHRAPLQFISDWALFGDFGWPVPDRGRIHQRWGPAFLVVSPGSVQLMTDDPQATEDVLRRTNAFVKPVVIYENIEYFGPNVDTVNGETWQRHRRLTTPPFNERNSGLVWRESLKQAEGMIARWMKEDLNAEELGQDTMKLALHVLTGAGFGKAYDFNAGTSGISKGHAMSYKDALAGILKDMRMAIIAHKVNGPPSWILPKSLVFMKECMAEFRQYMIEMTEEQRLDMGSKTNMQQDNLMSALVRANETSRTEGKERYSLSDEEIYGNLFIWSLAGHDTTATTLAYAFTVLSVHTEVQDWMAEEINSVLGDTPFEEWDYEEIFPQLKRCLATMYEVLRVYGPVASMAKQTETPQNLQIRGKDYTIPENCHLTLHLYSIHLSTVHWGSDAEVWRPQRFISKDNELVVPAAANTFVPWVNGPRVCPGKKFAQVEFVATMAMCLRGSRIAAVKDVGETDQGVRERVLGVARDSEMGVNPVVKMIHPERIKVKWMAV